MMNLTIHREMSEDFQEINTVTISAFLEAQHTSHTEHLIVKALRDVWTLTISLIAVTKEKVVGHVAVSPVNISDGALDWFELGPISVIPDYQKCGIGSKLMNEVLNVLQNSGAADCVLLGDPAYYNRFGFKPEPNLVLPGVPPEYCQAVCFKKPLPQGIVSYHEAFEVKG